MLERINRIRRSLVSKLILTVGLVLLLSISTWAYFNINFQKKKFMDDIIMGTDRLTNTIRLGAHYAMMLNSRDDINQIINNIGRQKEIETIRIYNKQGQIKFSNLTSEVDRKTNIEAEACFICHRSDPPLEQVALADRIRIFASPQGYRLLGIISPIANEPDCSTATCHVHPNGKKILGALDVVVSLQNTDETLRRSEKGSIGLAVFVFLLTSAIIFIFLFRFVNQPIQKLIKGTRHIATGDYISTVAVDQDDEMGQLALAINQMSEKIAQKQSELNKQRDEYQTLFEQVPCIITVQDKNFRMLRYNHEFEINFDPQPGDFCYHAYKGRDQKCPHCPVEKTFKDGRIHYGEETGFSRDGTPNHWLVRTSPIRNAAGEIVAAMEMSVDISERKQLEDQLEKSEKKYHEIFNNIPNPVFVLDPETLEIIDCNDSVETVYGYTKDQVSNRSFLDLFPDKDRSQFEVMLKKSAMIDHVSQLNRSGLPLIVNIRISPAEYPGRKVLLVTTSDITKRLETERQLIQASKMATLGEMATGIAHELNQPLSVIKTASSFSIKKVEKKESLEADVLFSILTKIDSNVDRATKIINHMRQFAHKSDMDLETLQVNDVLRRAFEIFSQQLKLRGIEVIWRIEEDLPKIRGDHGRLEQVFINLLLNARDAIEERWGSSETSNGAAKEIVLRTRLENDTIVCEVCDTGKGVPQELADKIFEPFFTTKEVGKGTGLGLSISYGIVKDCGGMIQVVPNMDEGTCFKITFPVPGKNNEKNNSPR